MNLQNIGNQENTAAARAKNTLSLAATKRSALGEIGNKVNSTRGTQPNCKNGLQGAAQKKPMGRTVQLESLKPLEKLPTKHSVKIIQPPSPKVRPPCESTVLPQQQQQQQQQLPEPSEKVSFSSDLLVEDIDRDDGGNPNLVSDYSNDIYEHLFDLEKKTPIDKYFLSDQLVTPKMRSVLVDWLVEVHQQFHLTQETLYLTIANIDRFLQVRYLGWYSEI